MLPPPLRSTEVANIYRRRLGVGDTELGAGQMDDLGELGSLDVLMAWKEYQRKHGGESICTGSASRSCEPRLLMDGSFAGWPVPTFEWSRWYAEQSMAVRVLFSHVNDWADLIVGPLVHRGQLRCNASGASIHTRPADRHSDDATILSQAARTQQHNASRPPIAYVVRGDDAFERVFVNRSSEWHAAVESCISGMDGGLYQDVSECIEGRMAANRFSIHFEAHFLGGDMGVRGD